MLEWNLPTFGEDDQTLFDWQATRMCNYMLHIMDTQLYKPKYCNPAEGDMISDSDVARLYGVLLGHSLSGCGAITDLWSTRDAFSACGSIKENMPQDTFKDLSRCMHFADDWDDDDERWDEVYADEKEEVPEGMARHFSKHRTLENK